MLRTPTRAPMSFAVAVIAPPIRRGLLISCIARQQAELAGSRSLPITRGMCATWHTLPEAMRLAIFGALR